MRDYYKILGVSPTATGQEIKKAYKKQVLKYHPDRNKSEDAREKFYLIQEAYDILSKKSSRAAYDRRYKSTSGNTDGYTESEYDENYYTDDTEYDSHSNENYYNKHYDESNRERFRIISYTRPGDMDLQDIIRLKGLVVLRISKEGNICFTLKEFRSVFTIAGDSTEYAFCIDYPRKDVLIKKIKKEREKELFEMLKKFNRDHNKRHFSDFGRKYWLTEKQIIRLIKDTHTKNYKHFIERSY